MADKMLATECKYGHPLSGENLWMYKGRRYCKTCDKRRAQELKERRKAAMQHHSAEAAQ